MPTADIAIITMKIAPLWHSFTGFFQYICNTERWRFAKEKSCAFEEIMEDIEIIGFISCGGCPGKKAVLRARELIERGADTIVFASCIQRGNPIGYPCPFAKKMKDIIVNDIGENVRIIDYTH
jgi:predicted metal-binding protein